MKNDVNSLKSYYICFIRVVTSKVIHVFGKSVINIYQTYLDVSLSSTYVFFAFAYVCIIISASR